jgi:hypothetical protein
VDANVAKFLSELDELERELGLATAQAAATGQDTDSPQLAKASSS